MSAINKLVQSLSNGEKSKWDLESSVEMYRATEQLQNWVLWKAKQDLVYGEFEQFQSIIGLSRAVIDRRVKFFGDKIKIGLSNSAPARQVLSETEAIEIENDKSNPLNSLTYTSYHALKGDTPEEKLETLDEVKEWSGKENPSREDVRLYSAKKRDEAKGEPMKLNDALEVINDEFGASYMEKGSEATGGSMSMLTVGIELFKYSKQWKKIYRELSKVAHPDLDGDEEVQKFVNWLNELFKERAKTKKAISVHDKMTERLAELTHG